MTESDDGLNSGAACTSEPVSSAEVWDTRYVEKQIWSGEPNHALVDLAGNLPAGTALDLGCGEGADAIWLAERGWQVTGIDVSTAALDRAEKHARDRGVKVTWQPADLATWRPTETVDLVSLFFVHSPVNFPREQILRAAASAVSAGGVLLVVGHATWPPWSRRHHEHREDHDGPGFPTVEETVTETGVSEPGWEILVRGNFPREVTGPDGERAEIQDAVLKARRLPSGE